MLRPTLALAALTLVVASGCRPDHRTRQQGATTLRIVNATDAPLCELYLAPTRSKLWGTSWLAQQVPASGHVDLAVRPDSYMMRVGYCSGDTALVVYHVDVDDDADFVVHEGYDTPPPSRSVAQLAFPTSKQFDSTARHIAAAQPELHAVDITVTSHCARDLRIVLGGDPVGRTGLPSTMPAGSFARYTAPVSTPLWIVDADYQPVSSTTLSADHPKLEINATCDGWTTG